MFSINLHFPINYNYIMKQVSFIKLNIQEDNILSKEERKKILGGYSPCYVRCSNGEKPAPDCSDWTKVNICNGEGPGGVYCFCR